MTDITYNPERQEIIKNAPEYVGRINELKKGKQRLLELAIFDPAAVPAPKLPSGYYSQPNATRSPSLAGSSDLAQQAAAVRPAEVVYGLDGSTTQAAADKIDTSDSPDLSALVAAVYEAHNSQHGVDN